MPLWLTDPYVHRCLSSGSLASRKCSGSPGTSVADLAFPPVLLEGLGRVGAHAASERMCNIWKLWVFQPWNSVILSVHWPQETWQTVLHFFSFSFFFFSDWTHLPTCFADSQGHCSSLPCKVLYKCGVLGRATTGFVFSLHQAKSLPFLAVPSPPSSGIPAKRC